MKTRILLALFAILIAVVAVGCSDSGRSTAPANAVEKLNIPNNNNVNRFEDLAAAGHYDGPENDYYFFTGEYNCDETGCQSLQVGKNRFVEVVFVYFPPRGLRTGQIVNVGGRFGSLPGGHCQYSQLFHIDQITIIADQRQEMKSNIPDSQ